MKKDGPSNWLNPTPRYARANYLTSSRAFERVASCMHSEIMVGAFFTRCKVENPAARDKSAIVPRVLIDSGSEYTWVPAAILERIGIKREQKELSFVMANGQTIRRAVGFAIIPLDKFFTIDEVVFAEKGDLSLLGARTLEGLNLTVDAIRRKLIAVGPLPAASVTKGRIAQKTVAWRMLRGGAFCAASC